MRTLFAFVLGGILVGCGVERPEPFPTHIRRLTLDMTPDTDKIRISANSPCIGRCYVIQMKGELYACLQAGRPWEKLSDFIEPGQAMYCRYEVSK